MQKAVREALTSKKVVEVESADKRRTHGSGDVSDGDDDDDDEAKFDARMRSQILRKRIELGDVATKSENPGMIFSTSLASKVL